MPSASQVTPLPVRAAQVWLSVLGALAPAAAGRSAADLFTKTRQSKPRGDARSMGARPLAVGGLVKEAHVFGEGTATVLLVHGWGAEQSSMFGLARALVAQGFRVVSFDAPGHGRSPERASTLAEFARAVGEVLDALGPVEAVVAHSLGGLAALGAVSARAERRPRRLVFVASPSRLADVFDAFCSFMRLAPSVTARTRSELVERNGVPVEHWDMATLGEGLAIPILVVHDRDDAFVPFAHADGVVRALPGARLEATNGLGHRKIVGDDGVHRRVAAFLRAN